MSRRVDLEIGRKFGKLTVCEKIPPNTKRAHPRWKCLCDCGGEIILRASFLLNGSNSSCGCHYHGKSKTQEYRILYDARKRSRLAGEFCDLEPEDITIPDVCPVLGIRLMAKGRRDHQPSIDKVDPNGGYVKSNICIISFRANRIKSNATLEELEAITDYVRNGGLKYANDNTSTTPKATRAA